MDIREITSKKEWDSVLQESGSLSFLQSWEWGEVKKQMGEEILRLGIYTNNTLQAVCLVEKMKSRRGRFLFIPHGPITRSDPVQGPTLKAFCDFLMPLAKKEGYSFIRIAPSLENTEENGSVFKELGFKKAPIYIHSENFWVLPLDKSEEELMSGMRKTTRYLIRKAVRDGVTIEKRTDKKAVDDFWSIYQETVKRERFSPYSKEYIRHEFESFHKTGNAIFLFGRINNEDKAKMPVSNDLGDPDVLVGKGSHFVRNTASSEYLAAALVLFTKNACCYHQGASIHTKIPVPYLLQWEAIREAKQHGCRFYNFWGILIKGRTPKDWDGLTTFKTGFGGYEHQYLPTQDYVISPTYYLTYVYETFLQWKKGV